MPGFVGMGGRVGMAVAQEAGRVVHSGQLPASFSLRLPGLQEAQHLRHSDDVPKLLLTASRYSFAGHCRAPPVLCHTSGWRASAVPIASYRGPREVLSR